MVKLQGMCNVKHPHHLFLFMGSTKLVELGTKSYTLSYSLSALLHPMQTRLSLSIPAALHFSTS